MSPFALPLLLCAIFGTSLTQAEEPKVIIIGAGAAGLAAATKLLENGIDVTVLEAESRIGGRIHTKDFADGHVEMGAQFVYGEKGNVVYEMVKDMNLLESTEMGINIYASNQMDIDDKIVFETANIFIKMSDTWRNNSVEGVSIGDQFFKMYKQEIMKNHPGDEVKQKEALALMNTFRHLIMGFEGTNDWNDSAASSSYKECEGEEYMNWKNHGYKIFLDVLMKKYPNKTENFDIDSKIQLGKVVEEIKWDEDMVTVKCDGGVEMKANYVIFTPSLGVLKEKHSELFTPDLPENKMEAIEKLGFGTLAVVMMHFPVVWWTDDDFKGYTLLWVDEDDENIDEKFTEGPIEDGKSWLTDLYYVAPAKGNPNVLEMWFSGKMVPKIEKMDDQVLMNGIDYAMKKFFNFAFTISKADKIIKSDWFSNPHFKGGSSYETIKSRELKDPSGFERMSEPLMKGDKPMVMFAGEATHPHYFATVHGAVESGWREAKRVLNHIKDMKH